MGQIINIDEIKVKGNPQYQIFKGKTLKIAVKDYIKLDFVYVIIIIYEKITICCLVI